MISFDIFSNQEARSCVNLGSKLTYTWVCTNWHFKKKIPVSSENKKHPKERKFQIALDFFKLKHCIRDLNWNLRRPVTHLEWYSPVL